MKRAKCIRCGCTDARSCPGGCGWTEGLIDRAAGLGVCSMCAARELARNADVNGSIDRVRTALRRELDAAIENKKKKEKRALRMLASLRALRALRERRRGARE